MTYHAPYNDEYHYWTGLLLLVRGVLYIIAAITESGYPQILLLMTIIIIACLLCLKGLKLYKKVFVDILEIIVLLNLLSLAAISLFQFKANSIKQKVAVYVSTGITALLLMIVIVYHIVVLLCKKKTGSCPKARYISTSRGTLICKRLLIQ